jgi:hypothetical protein
MGRQTTTPEVGMQNRADLLLPLLRRLHLRLERSSAAMRRSSLSFAMIIPKIGGSCGGACGLISGRTGSTGYGAMPISCGGRGVRRRSPGPAAGLAPTRGGMMTCAGA